MRRWMVSGSIAFVGVLALGHLTQAQGLPSREPALGVAELDAPTLRQVVTGRVCLPDGTPASGAVVVTSAGGQVVTGAGGTFRLELELPFDAESLIVRAVVDGEEESGSLVANARIVPSALSPFASVGALALAPTTGCQPRWLPTFGEQPGVGGSSGPPHFFEPSIQALAVFDDGGGAALHAGGRFTTAGGVAANCIAKWDGSRWSALGSGMTGDSDFVAVHALTVFDDGTGAVLYAGGEFTTAGGVAANHIAKWNGSSWAVLGNGMGASGPAPVAVYALTVFDDGDGPALHAGGEFTTAGGVAASHIARWDGSSWRRLGSGISSFSSSSRVQALAVFDDGSGPALYVGGWFTRAGGQAANHIARWDGSTWTALASGVADPFSTPRVRALTVYDDGGGPALYAGGVFATAGGVAAVNMARWNSSSWSALGNLNAEVSALAVFDAGSGPALYAGGSFTNAGGVGASRIARWNGSRWSKLGRGTNAAVQALAAFDDGSGPALHAGGSFTTASDVGVGRIAKWDGSSWTASSGGVTCVVAALTVWNDGLYAAGDLSVGGVPANRIARWDGSSWAALGRGMNGRVNALTTFQDGFSIRPELYAGGGFTTAGDVAANHIAKWDGSNWSSPGSGMNGAVDALAVFDDGSGPALYVGGEFTRAGGVAANRVAKWNGSSWSSLGSGLNGVVYALAVFDAGSGPALYVGGEFTGAFGVAANRIARWDGSHWSALGSGMTHTSLPAFVAALAVFDDGGGPALYAGGRFETAGGAAASRIARWDGSNWSALGSGLNSVVWALMAFDDGSGPALYAGGNFSTADGLAARKIAKWDGLHWSALGSGLTDRVLALTVFDDRSGPALYLGGEFAGSPAGDSYLAKWGGCKSKTKRFPRRGLRAATSRCLPARRRSPLRASSPVIARRP